MRKNSGELNVTVFLRGTQCPVQGSVGLQRPGNGWRMCRGSGSGNSDHGFCSF